MHHATTNDNERQLATHSKSVSTAVAAMAMNSCNVRERALGDGAASSWADADLSNRADAKAKTSFIIKDQVCASTKL